MSQEINQAKEIGRQFANGIRSFASRLPHPAFKRAHHSTRLASFPVCQSKSLCTKSKRVKQHSCYEDIGPTARASTRSFTKNK